jgi:hypothetical protein
MIGGPPHSADRGYKTIREAATAAFKAASPQSSRLRCTTEATMRPTELASQNSSQAEKLRRLRLQLAGTVNEPQRHIILRQIEELEEESKDQLKS